MQSCGGVLGLSSAVSTLHCCCNLDSISNSGSFRSLRAAVFFLALVGSHNEPHYCRFTTCVIFSDGTIDANTRCDDGQKWEVRLYNAGLLPTLLSGNWSDALRRILTSCYESNWHDVEEYVHPDEEDSRERSILPADLQGPPTPPSPLPREPQQSCPPANEDEEQDEIVTQQRGNGGRRQAKRPRYEPLDGSNATSLALRKGRRSK